MCGICGMFVPSGIGGRERESLASMNSRLVHRGPDDEGFYFGNKTAFGHRRLSVIDLSSGRQPLSNEDDTVWITFNGEIYNYRELRSGLEAKGHRFKTRTDTEVIVHLYEERGLDALASLNGMFSFAIWDGRKEKLLLARDRAGIKPLYYVERGGCFFFASELSALLAGLEGQAQIDEEALCRYLLLQYVPGPGTMVKGVRKLAPGTALVLDNEGRKELKYWQVPETEKKDRTGLLERLEAAVSSQLVSDVPLGAFLSGGIDSSAVVALMRKAGPGLTKTFSIGFDGPSAYDERPFARRVAEHLGTEHYETVLSPEGFVEYFQRAVTAMDEPVADPAAVPTLKLSELAREHVTVVLTGEGGDELFGGYKRYLFEHIAGGRLNGPVSRMAVRASGSVFNDRRKLKALRALSSRDWPEAHMNWTSVFLKEELEELTAGNCGLAWDNTALLFKERGSRSGARLDSMMKCDFSSWLPDDLLTKVDRMSMAVSLEARVPFLDNDIVDLALSADARLKIKGLKTKYMLKKALAGLLPEDVLKRPKRGFDLPLAAWFRGPLKGYVRGMLGGGYPAFFDRKYVAGMVDEHESGRKDWALPLFSIMVFKEWSQRIKA